MIVPLPDATSSLECVVPVAVFRDAADVLVWMTQLFAAFTPDTIRASEPIRRTLAERAAEIQRNLAGYMGAAA